MARSSILMASSARPLSKSIRPWSVNCKDASTRGLGGLWVLNVSSSCTGGLSRGNDHFTEILGAQLETAIPHSKSMTNHL